MYRSIVIPMIRRHVTALDMAVKRRNIKQKNLEWTWFLSCKCSTALTGIVVTPVIRSHRANEATAIPLGLRNEGNLQTDIITKRLPNMTGMSSTSSTYPAAVPLCATLRIDWFSILKLKLLINANLTTINQLDCYQAEPLWHSELQQKYNESLL